MNWAAALEVAEKITTIVVLSLGAIGAYYKFLKGRIFKPRLQLDVGGRVICDGDVTCLLVNLQLKNVGASTVQFNKEGTLIEVYYYGAEYYEPTPHLAFWQPLKKFRIFENLGWIESGEQTQDAVLIALPRKREVAFRVDMTVIAHGIAFKTRGVIDWPKPDPSSKQKKEAPNEPV